MPCTTGAMSGVLFTIMMIRQATPADMEAMWAVFRSVMAQRDSLPFADGFDRETFHSLWSAPHTAYVDAHVMFRFLPPHDT